MNLHIIAIPMTGVGVGGGFRSQSWYAHRVRIFKDYTLKSLQNQSNKDFLIWMWLRPEEQWNPMTGELEDALKASGLNYLISYNGLLYHDDKFTVCNLRTRMRNLLKMLWDGYHAGQMKPLREMLKYTWENKNSTLPGRLAKALECLKSTVGSTYDWVYLTRLDSDDMLHRDAVALIQSRQPDYKKALVMDKGYMYNVVTGQLGEWLPPTNPPFHTIVFPSHIFFDARRHLEYYGAFKSHEDIPKVFDAETLDLYKYCVTFHAKHISTAWDVPLPKRVYQEFKYARPYCYSSSGQNISTHWQSRTRKVKNRMIGEEYTGPEEKREIMAQFGIEI